MHYSECWSQVQQTVYHFLWAPILKLCRDTGASPNLRHGMTAPLSSCPVFNCPMPQGLLGASWAGLNVFSTGGGGVTEHSWCQVQVCGEEMERGLTRKPWGVEWWEAFHSDAERRGSFYERGKARWRHPSPPHSLIHMIQLTDRHHCYRLIRSTVWP